LVRYDLLSLYVCSGLKGACNTAMQACVATVEPTSDKIVTENGTGSCSGSHWQT
jgi:hypothetical protein